MGKLEIVTIEERVFPPAHDYNDFEFAFHFYKLVMWPYFKIPWLTKSETRTSSCNILVIRAELRTILLREIMNYNRNSIVLFI